MREIQLAATVWPISRSDPNFKMLCIKMEQSGDITFLCVLYHLLSPIYDTVELLDLVGNTVLLMHQDYLDLHIILAGDLTLTNKELVIST